MAEYTYDPGFVIDDVTFGPVANATGEFRATPDGPPEPIYDQLGNPIASLVTNDVGYVRRFSADIAFGYVSFGDLAEPVASDQNQNALPAAEAAQAAAEAARVAAEDAASQVAAAVQNVTVEIDYDYVNNTWPPTPSPAPENLRWRSEQQAGVAPPEFQAGWRWLKQVG